MTVFIVRLQTEDGIYEAGRLTFVPGCKESLSAANTPAGEQLKSDWGEISSKETIVLKTSEPSVVDGQSVMEYKGRMVTRGEDDYKWAVHGLLRRRYGYDIEVID